MPKLEISPLTQCVDSKTPALRFQNIFLQDDCDIKNTIELLGYLFGHDSLVTRKTGPLPFQQDYLSVQYK